MRSFQNILHELKSLVREQRPGEILKMPESVSSIDVDGRRLSYVAAGLDRSPDRPPVILLHGFGGFFMDWPRIMAPVSRHTRVYALDLPGWGFSDPHHGANSLEHGVETIDRFMKSLALNRVILCGISYGAGLAWATAAMGHPRVKEAILLNPMPPHPMRFMRSAIYKSIFVMSAFERTSALGHKLLNKSQYKIICRENLLNDRLLDTFYLDLAYLVIKQPKMSSVLRAHASGAKNVDWGAWEHRLSGIKIPVSILQGLEDRVFSLEAAKYLHRMIPTSQLIEVEKCGHAMVFDQHRKVSDVILRTLEKSIEPSNDRFDSNEDANGTIQKKA